MIYNPEMLRLARQRNGFQQIEAAKRLGIEQPVLSRLENGLSEIKTEFVKKAAFVYDLPEAFFAQTDPVFGAPVSVHPMWRKKADVSGRELDIVVAEMNVRAMHLRRLFEGVSISNTSDLPRLDVEDYGTPQNVAAVLRAHWMLPPGPIKNLTALAEKAGAVVVRRTRDAKADRLKFRSTSRSDAIHVGPRTGPPCHAPFPGPADGGGGQCLRIFIVDSAF
jgi:hypothetical protein